MYPKAQAPLTWAVYKRANERADRWQDRTLAARKECDRLKAILKENGIDF